MRADGEREVGAVLLGVSSELMAFDFRETFVNAFEVGRLLHSMLHCLPRRTHVLDHRICFNRLLSVSLGTTGLL